MTRQLRPRKGKGKEEGADLVRRSKANPTPSVHQRHRAVPSSSRAGHTKRLAARPSLFDPPCLTLTTSFMEHPKLSEWVNKAWGFNVGCGPLWDLVESRGWYKEAIITGNNTDTEAKRRPQVYPDIRVQEGWEVVCLEVASPYLPTNNITTEVRQDVKMLEAFPMSKYTPESKAHVFNVGAPVWGMDWCPIHALDQPARSYKQYLAVARSFPFLLS